MWLFGDGYLVEFFGNDVSWNIILYNKLVVD